jgi:hypothetical protein
VSIIRSFIWQGTTDTGGGGPSTPTTNDVVVSGIPRTMLAWRSNSGTPWLAIGTHTKAYGYNGALYDITPASGFTTGAAQATLASGVYGTGNYGIGLYGTGDTTTFDPTPAGVWQFDTFGQNLVGVLPADGDLWMWDLNSANDFVALTDADTNYTPNQLTGVVVTPERFLVALGYRGDGRVVAWASQETTGTWKPSSTNTAGDFPLSTVGRLVAGRRGRGETLLWTDVDLWVMRYIGGTGVFGFERAGMNCGLIASNAVAMLDGVAYWMSPTGFHKYDGYVQDIPCEVSDYVFSEFNAIAGSQCHAVPIAAYNEVWFFYCSNLSQEVDRYAILNTKEGHWSIGLLPRTCGVDAGAFQTPIMAHPDGRVFEHEKGWSHGSLVPFATSGPMELGAGDNIMMVRRVIPDEKTAGDAQVWFDRRFFPNAVKSTEGPFVLGNPTNVRFTARQVSIRIQEARPGNWRVGDFRVDVVQGGER